MGPLPVRDWLRTSKALERISIPEYLVETLDWLLALDDFEGARELAFSAWRRLDWQTNDPLAFDFMAFVLFKARHYEEAAGMALRVLELEPGSFAARLNAARCLSYARRAPEAERLMREALRDEPEPGRTNPDAWIDLALYVSAQGRGDEARAILESVGRRLPPGDRRHDVLAFNLGWHLLRAGQFREGMRGLRMGRKLGIWGSRLGITRPLLADGESVRGKRVLVCGEAGIGDEIINARFASHLNDAGATVIWASNSSVGSLFSRTPGISERIPPGEIEGADFDRWVPCMDLVQTLGLGPQDLFRKPYLSADPRLEARWGNRLGSVPGLKVGIRWQGNSLYENDLMRTVPFSLLEGLAEVPGVRLFSLQRDQGAEQLKSSSSVVDLGPELTSWEETAAVVANLDLVISSCTSVAHLAAAMGKPTWVLCPLLCYFVWALPGEESPWYPNVRLFRQRSYGSWLEPIAAARAALGAKTRILGQSPNSSTHIYSQGVQI